MSLTGPQLEPISKAILAAYDRDSLRRVVKGCMDVDFDAVAPEKGFGDQLWTFVVWANRQGKILTLLQCAAQYNPENAELSALLAAWQAASGATDAHTSAAAPCQVELEFRWSHLLTSVYHVLPPEELSVAVCTLRNPGPAPVQVVVNGEIKGYSDPFIATVRLAPDQVQTVYVHPNLLPEKVAGLQVAVNGTVHVAVIVQDAFAAQVIADQTFAIKLVPRNETVIAVKSPVTGEWIDWTRYLGVYVTPTAPKVLEFVGAIARRAAGAIEFAGYRGIPLLQVRALYDALHEGAQIATVSSYLATVQMDGAAMQRAQLPRETLANNQGSELDIALLMASLIEAIALEAALVLTGNYPLVAWNAAPGGENWQYLDCAWRVLPTGFNAALERGENMVAAYRKLDRTVAGQSYVRLLPIRKLRYESGILPLE